MAITETDLSDYCVESAGRSEKGLVRKNNEDAWARETHHNFFVLADGIGGRNAGEIAAQQSVQQMCSLIQKAPTHPSLAEHYLPTIIEKTNETIFEMAQNNEFLHSMGSTLCCAWLLGSRCYFAHLGDSRIYLLRGTTFIRLTQDHTGEKKNQITKAIGVRKKVRADYNSIPIQIGDLLLLCSDGLTSLMSDEEIKESLISHQKQPSACAEKLIRTCLSRGGTDNITTLLVHILKKN